jgi:hypothetical protein
VPYEFFIAMRGTERNLLLQKAIVDQEAIAEQMLYPTFSPFARSHENAKFPSDRVSDEYS